MFEASLVAGHRSSASRGDDSSRGNWSLCSHFAPGRLGAALGQVLVNAVPSRACKGGDRGQRSVGQRPRAADPGLSTKGSGPMAIAGRGPRQGQRTQGQRTQGWRPRAPDPRGRRPGQRPRAADPWRSGGSAPRQGQPATEGSGPMMAIGVSGPRQGQWTQGQRNQGGRPRAADPRGERPRAADPGQRPRAADPAHASGGRTHSAGRPSCRVPPE